jgi:hypothetical protein
VASSPLKATLRRMDSEALRSMSLASMRAMPGTCSVRPRACEGSGSVSLACPIHSCTWGSLELLQLHSHL